MDPQPPVLHKSATQFEKWWPLARLLKDKRSYIYEHTYWNTVLRWGSMNIFPCGSSLRHFLEASNGLTSWSRKNKIVAPFSEVLGHFGPKGSYPCREKCSFSWILYHFDQICFICCKGSETLVKCVQIANNVISPITRRHRFSKKNMKKTVFSLFLYFFRFRFVGGYADRAS